MSPLPRSSSPLGVFLPACGRLTPVGPTSTSSSSGGRASVDALWSPIKDVLHRVFSNDQSSCVEEPMESPVVFCEDLCLSPLAAPYNPDHHDNFNKNALERSMSGEAAAMDEWRGTTHVRMPGPSPMTSSCSPPAKSPYARSPAPGATPMQRSLSREWDRCRTWLHKGAPELPLPDLEPSGSKQLQYSMDDLGGSCSIKEDELPTEMPIEQEELDRIQRQHGQPPHRAMVQANPSDADGNDGDGEDSDNDTAGYSSAAAAARAAGGEGESMWERVFKAGRFANKAAAGAMEKRRRPPPGTDGAGGERRREPPRYDAFGKKLKKRRVVKKDPNKPKPKPWSETELEHFRHLLVTEGPTDWQGKAEKLGTGRTAKSLHTRWLRDEGRIVDRPRGMAAMREQAQQAAAAAAAAAAGGGSGGGGGGS